jgi:hypothetical protein
VLVQLEVVDNVGPVRQYVQWPVLRLRYSTTQSSLPLVLYQP